MPNDITPQSPVLADIRGAAADSFKRQIPSHLYHADREIVSCSMLKPMLKSPAHYIAALTALHDTEAMQIGTVYHALVLEPQTIHSVVALYPGPLDRSKDAQAFKAANRDRICLPLTTFLTMQDVAARVRESEFRGRPFYRYIEEGEVEASLYFTDPTTGVRCRSRMDLWHPDYTFDLKTTSTCGPQAFQKHGLDLDYDLQGFMYSYARALFDGTSKAKPFVFVAAETSEPHSVFYMPANDSFINNGCAKYKSALSSLKACTLSDHWPAPFGEYDMDLLPWQTYSPSTTTWNHSV